MIKLDYTYITASEIFKDIVFIKDFDILWNIIISFLIMIWIIIVLYILPIFYSIKENHIKQKEEKRKKLLLKQIIIQRKVEDEILNEVKKH